MIPGILLPLIPMLVSLAEKVIPHPAAPDPSADASAPLTWGQAKKQWVMDSLALALEFAQEKGVLPAEVTGDLESALKQLDWAVEKAVEKL